MSVFINRKEELAMLKERYNYGRAEFLIIYGRRRVGKTELVERFLSMKDVKGIRLMAREESKYFQLNRFKERLSEFFHDDYLRKIEWQDWDAFFEYIFNKTKRKRLVIAIDEFPYLLKEDASLLSVLQDYWDRKLRKTKIFLILLGSYISVMERIAGGKSPLYGRRTGQIHLKPLRFDDLSELIRDVEKRVEYYGVFGGSPAYIMEINPERNIIDNIKEKVLRLDSFLYRDVEFLLREELEEPRYYFSILHAISMGNHKLGNICNATGLSKSIVNKYLSVLIDLHIVRREVPVTETSRSKKGLYFIEDNFVDFWFRFVFPYLELVENHQQDLLLNQKIKPYLSEYLGKKFERIVLEIFIKKYGKEFDKMGRWWHKDKEIDIIAINEETKELLAVEVKWQDLKLRDVKQIINELHEKLPYMQWENDKRKEILGIFAKKVEKKAKEWLSSRGYKVWDLSDVEKII